MVRTYKKDGRRQISPEVLGMETGGKKTARKTKKEMAGRHKEEFKRQKYRIRRSIETETL